MDNNNNNVREIVEEDSTLRIYEENMSVKLKNAIFMISYYTLFLLLMLVVSVVLIGAVNTITTLVIESWDTAPCIIDSAMEIGTNTAYTVTLLQYPNVVYTIEVPGNDTNIIVGSSVSCFINSDTPSDADQLYPTELISYQTIRNWQSLLIACMTWFGMLLVVIAAYALLQIVFAKCKTADANRDLKSGTAAIHRFRDIENLERMENLQKQPITFLGRSESISNASFRTAIQVLYYNKHFNAEKLENESRSFRDSTIPDRIHVDDEDHSNNNNASENTPLAFQNSSTSQTKGGYTSTNEQSSSQSRSNNNNFDDEKIEVKDSLILKTPISCYYITNMVVGVLLFFIILLLGSGFTILILSFSPFLNAADILICIFMISIVIGYVAIMISWFFSLIRPDIKSCVVLTDDKFIYCEIGGTLLDILLNRKKHLWVDVYYVFRSQHDKVKQRTVTTSRNRYEYGLEFNGVKFPENLRLSCCKSFLSFNDVKVEEDISHNFLL